MRAGTMRRDRFGTLGDRPRVPWTPAPIDVLRVRYPAAVAGLFDQREVAAGRQATPSGDPAHVFDTQSGLRLIISRDRLGDGRIGVHVSASWCRDVSPGATAASLVAEIRAWWEALSGSTRTLEFLGVSEGGIPHFFVEQAN